MSIKITLTPEAINALIESDPTTALEIKNSIASEFAKRYLKGLIDNEFRRQLMNELNTQILIAKREITQFSTTLEIRKQIRAEIEKVSSDVVDSAANDAFAGKVKSLFLEASHENNHKMRSDFEAMIKERLLSLNTGVIKSSIDDALNDAISDSIAEKIKDKVISELFAHIKGS